MKANSLSISIPSVSVCKKNCPYCISKMTGKATVDFGNFFQNIHKAKTLSNHANVSSIIISGKTEPLQPENFDMLKEICKVFKEYPIEIQTNGLSLKLGETQRVLKECGVNTIAVSIDSYSQFKGMLEILRKAYFKSFNNRVTINLTTDIMEHNSTEYVNLCKRFGINQLSFRELTIPKFPVDSQESYSAIEYIETIDPLKVALFIAEFQEKLKNAGMFVRSLPFGASIYMLENVSCTVFEECIQENSNDEDIRTLIYWEDGHMSTSWYSSNHGRIF